MITSQQIEQFFADTRSTYASGRSSWSIDETCRWSYFFVDPDLNKLLSVAEHMESLGYEIAGTLDPEAGDVDPVFYLRVDKIERHSPQSLQLRNNELYGVAEQFDLLGYDGMDVGALDGP
jgi:hypothetical protein